MDPWEDVFLFLEDCTAWEQIVPGGKENKKSWELHSKAMNLHS